MSLLTKIHSHAMRGENMNRVLVSPDGAKLQHAKLGFQGHGVSAKPGEKCVKDARNLVEGALRERYGDNIVDAMRSNRSVWGSSSKPMTLRKALALDHQAAKLERHVTSNNLRGGRAMLREGLDEAIKNFQDGHELPSNLTKEERQSILQQASQKMLASPIMHRRPVTAGDAREFLTAATLSFYAKKAVGFHEGMENVRDITGISIKANSLEAIKSELENLSLAEQGIAKDSLEILADGFELLGDCPINKADVDEVSEIATGMKSAIDDKLEEIAQLKLGGDVSPTLLALEKELLDMKGKLDDHVSYLTDFLKCDPVAKQNVEKTVWMHSRAALLAIDKLAIEHPDKAQGLQVLRDQIEQHSDNRRVAGKLGDQDVPDIKAFLKQGYKEIDDMLKDGMRDLGISGKAEKLVHKQATEAQNKFADFDPINTTYKHRMGQKAYDVHSTITPARHIDSLRQSYEDDNIRGISSGSSSESRHCVNLAHTEARAQDGTVIFKAMRHGVLSAFGIPKGILATIKNFFTRGDNNARETANTNRAKEVVKAHFTHDPDLLARAIDNARNGRGPVEMDISSIGLITPDNSRRFLNFISGGLAKKDANEYEQMNDQFAAWKSVEGVHTFDVPDPDNVGQTIQVQVKVDTLAFNFGVNQGAVVGAGPISSSCSMLGGWQNVKSQNEAAMTKLFGDISSESAPLGGKVEAFLKSDASENDKRIVRELATQIRFMWNNETYQVQGGEPYKMVARLAVLCDKIGLKVAFNCKSGKDRTGMLDAEAKNLAAYIHYQGTVPELGRELTPQDKLNERDAILRGGCLKMQENCVGIGGYKLGNVDDNFSRIGATGRKKKDVIDAPALRAMEGGAKFVKE